MILNIQEYNSMALMRNLYYIIQDYFWELNVAFTSFAGSDLVSTYIRKTFNICGHSVHKRYHNRMSKSYKESWTCHPQPSLTAIYTRKLKRNASEGQLRRGRGLGRQAFVGKSLASTSCYAIRMVYLKAFVGMRLSSLSYLCHKYPKRLFLPVLWIL